MIMNDNEGAVQESAVLEVVVNVGALLGQTPIAPEVFMEQIKDLQRAIALPFDSIENATITAKLHVLRITFPASDNDGEQIKAVLRGFLNAAASVEQFAVRRLKKGVGVLKLSGGIESGSIAMRRGEPYGEAATLADAYATEAEKKGHTLIMGLSLFERIVGSALSETGPEAFEFTGAKGVKRDVVSLTKTQLQALAGAQAT